MWAVLLSEVEVACLSTEAKEKKKGWGLKKEIV